VSRRRSIKVLSVLAGASLIIAACSDDDDDDAATDGTETTTEAGADTTTGGTEAPGTTTGETEAPGTTTEGTEPAEGGEPTGTVINAQEQEFFSYNNNTAESNAASNGLVLNKVLPDTFFFQGGDGALVMDENLLDSAELTSEDPFTVEYVVNADAVWSDGDPIDCDDFFLSWIASNGVLEQQDDAGNPVMGEDGVTPLLVFSTAGTTGFDQIESLECSEDGKTITTTYSAPFADWNSLFTDIMPAHIATRRVLVFISVYPQPVRPER
jgi:peptide/nickel transport system substrate-binding protein